jgi:hypothetical protein
LVAVETVVVLVVAPLSSVVSVLSVVVAPLPLAPLVVIASSVCQRE